MNIVFIGPFGLQPKGTMSARALPLAKALVAQGHRLTLLIPPWDDPARAGQSWVEEGVQVVNVALPRGLGRLPLLFHIILTYVLVVRALALQPEVIHFFKPKAYAGLAHLGLWGLRHLKRLSARLVVDADDWEQAWNEVSPYSPAQKWFFAWQERWGLRHADAVTAASRAIEQLVTTSLEVSPERIFYVPNGWSESSQAMGISLPEKGTRDTPTLLLYSRFWEFRLERIVTLVKFVAERIPPARWLLVGQGLRGEEKILEAKLTAAGLSQYAHFTGWLPIDRLPACFKAADVAVYPFDNTLINRTKCSVKLIELLAAGLPVVADAVGQNGAYIQSGISGILTPAEDDAALGEALVRLLQQPNLRQKLGQAAAHTIQTKFNWSILCQVCEQAYQ